MRRPLLCDFERHMTGDFIFGITMFLDEANIIIRAGDGGCGCRAFRREKYVPRGGPSGGDGGRGGHVYMKAVSSQNTLSQFRYKKVCTAKRGEHGLGSNCHGRDGSDLTIEVPVGTLAFESNQSKLIHDFTVSNEVILICKGGRGGRGNARFATSVNRAPRYFENGVPGENLDLHLELKLLADVGLVGFPNVGKSTLISRISAARPKIANYPFTTLEPVLGVVLLEDYQSFVVADIPGLIAGAHLGQGLGIKFLRHIERTKILLHLVDMSAVDGREPFSDYEAVIQELNAFSPNLLQKPTLIVATKIDAMQNPDQLKALCQMAKRQGLECQPISSVKGQGLSELKVKIWKMLKGFSTL